MTIDEALKVLDTIPTIGEQVDALEMAIEALEKQSRTGRWMHPYKSDIACECSECHIQMPITKDFNYCPNCGARMEVSE